MNISEHIEQAELACESVFKEIDRREERHTRRVLSLFQKHRIALRHFSGSEGYGYDDIGRDTLEKLIADLFNTEAAIFRPQIASGTHACWANGSDLRSGPLAYPTAPRAAA